MVDNIDHLERSGHPRPEHFGGQHDPGYPEAGSTTGCVQGRNRSPQVDQRSALLNLANRSTVSRMFNRDMSSPKVLARRREVVVDTILRYLKRGY